MQPRRIREQYSTADIRTWFEAADLDGNGELSINEFFQWSLSNAAEKYGASSLRAAFERFDTSGNGILNSYEFEQAAAEMGFGQVAGDIFRNLDTDNSGQITYDELLQAVQKNAPKDPYAKKVLTSLVWSWDKETKAESSIDTSTWVVKGVDAATVRSELQQLMVESGCQVADLIKVAPHPKPRPRASIASTRAVSSAYTCTCMHIHSTR